MSLILEALRKSEAERRRDAAPNVALELPPASTRGNGSTPGWVWPTLAAVVAVAVLAGWLGMRAGTRDHTANNTPQIITPAVVTSAATSPGAVLEPAIAPTTASTPMPASTPTTSPASAALPAPSTTAVATAPARDTAVRLTAHPVPPPPAAPLAPSRPAPAPLPADDINNAPPIASTGLPAVKLSMHMWDAEPNKRFVILDGQRMGEGDRLGTLSVVTIERNGVIIERNGQRARLPLP